MPLKPGKSNAVVRCERFGTGEVRPQTEAGRRDRASHQREAQAEAQLARHHEERRRQCLTLLSAV